MQFFCYVLFYDLCVKMWKIYRDLTLDMKLYHPAQPYILTREILGSV